MRFGLCVNLCRIFPCLQSECASVPSSMS
jgi:hypothetical protein